MKRKGSSGPTVTRHQTLLYDLNNEKVGHSDTQTTKASEGEGTDGKLKIKLKSNDYTDFCNISSYAKLSQFMAQKKRQSDQEVFEIIGMIHQYAMAQKKIVVFEDCFGENILSD